MSEFARGKIVQKVWWRDKIESISVLKLVGDEKPKIGNFDFEFIYSKDYPQFISPLIGFFRFLFRSIGVASREKFDIVYAYGTNTTGLTGVIVKLIFGIKLIIEIPGSPEKAFIFDAPMSMAGSSVKRKLANISLKFCLRFADGIKLLYPTQLDYLGSHLPKKLEKFCFHDLAPVSSVAVDANSSDERTIFFIGYPWYLKGVDVLIDAFKQIENVFPEYRLEVWGHSSPAEERHFRKLAEGSDRITFGKGISYDEAITKMSKCSVLVLPSRTEAMGRVILEAFYLGKPVVASAVDGIPHYIKDNISGLLFHPNDALDLAEKLKRVLKDEDLRNRLVENGKQEFQQLYSEIHYSKHFRSMLDQLLSTPK